MAYRGNFSAASRQAEKVDVRYMYVPSIGAMLTAAPRDHWNTEKPVMRRRWRNTAWKWPSCCLSS